MRAGYIGIACFAIAALVAGPASATTSDVRLLASSKQDDVQALKSLLAKGANVNAHAGDGSTALHWAAHNDDLIAADLLIRGGAHVNAATDLGITPLWIAATNSDAAMVKRLLDAGADPNLAPATNGTPLMIASRLGNADAVRALLAHGADPNAKEAFHGQTALMWAVSDRHPEVVRLLLQAHADPRARTKTWTQRVLLCCQYYEGQGDGDADVIKGGYTPLMFGAQDGDVDSVKLLLRAGADVHDVAPDGSSVLLLAAHAGQSDVARLLLDAGADPNAAGPGYTALHVAAASGNLELLKTLLDHGADINARQLTGSPTKRTQNGHSLDHALVGATPYFVAVRAGQLEAMTLLAARGADLTIPLRDGRTALMVLAGKETIEGPIVSDSKAAAVVHLAAKLGAPVNQTDADGNTALHVAATYRRDQVIQALVDCGAMLETRNHAGDTPLALALKPPPALKGAGFTDDDAYRLHHVGTAELLRKLGAKT